MLLDALLLAKCDDLLKSTSSVSDFAIYWSASTPSGERPNTPSHAARSGGDGASTRASRSGGYGASGDTGLVERAYDLQLKGQPPPPWARACERHRSVSSNGDSKGRSSTITGATGTVAAAATRTTSAAATTATTAAASSSHAHGDGRRLGTQNSFSTERWSVGWNRTRCPRPWVDPLRGSPFPPRFPSLVGSHTANVLGVLPSASKASKPRGGDSVARSGVAARHPPSSLPEEGVCARLGEQGAFEAQCASRVAQMRDLHASSRGRRGLIFEVLGRSVWGLGHILSYASSAAIIPAAFSAAT